MIGLWAGLLIAAAGPPGDVPAAAPVPLTAPPAAAADRSDLRAGLLPSEPGPSKSVWAALSLTVACELPTAFFGPSCGHLYAGEQAHFLVTGGLRAADFLALVVLEKWGYGVPPLYDVVQTHFSRSLAAEPLAYPVDLILVALWWGTGLYDLIDSVFAAKRANRRSQLLRPSASASGLPLLTF